MGKIVPYRDLTAGRRIRTIRTLSGGRTRRGDPHNPHTLRGSNPAWRSAQSAHPPGVEPGAAIRTIRTPSGGRTRRGDPHDPHTLRGSSPAWRSARSAHPPGVEPGAAIRTIRTPSGGRARRGDPHDPHTLRGSNPARRSARSAHSPGVEPGVAIRTIRTPFGGRTRRGDPHNPHTLRGSNPARRSAQSAHRRTLRSIPDRTTICCISCVMNIDIWYRRGSCRGDPRRVAGLWPPLPTSPLTKGEKYERIRRMNPGSALHRPRGRRVLDVPRVANQDND